MPTYADWIDSILAELELPGDVNGDGWVSGTDLSIVIDNWGQSGLDRALGDLNDNGVVDGPDYAEVLSYWDPPQEPPEPGSVPEPASLSLLFLGGLATLGRRRSACALIDKAHLHQMNIHSQLVL